MRSFRGFAGRFIAVLCCASALLGAIVLANSNQGAGIEERSVYEPKIDLIAEVECGRGCTFILSPADQKAIAAGGIAAVPVMAVRACGANVTCNALAAAGAALITMYVSEHGSDTCDMHIRVQPSGVTTAVIVTHKVVCAGDASPAE